MSPVIIVTTATSAVFFAIQLFCYVAVSSGEAVTTGCPPCQVLHKSLEDGIDQLKKTLSGWSDFVNSFDSLCWKFWDFSDCAAEHSCDEPSLEPELIYSWQLHGFSELVCRRELRPIEVEAHMPFATLPVSRGPMQHSVPVFSEQSAVVEPSTRSTYQRQDTMPFTTLPVSRIPVQHSVPASSEQTAAVESSASSTHQRQAIDRMNGKLLGIDIRGLSDRSIYIIIIACVISLIIALLCLGICLARKLCCSRGRRNHPELGSQHVYESPGEPPAIPNPPPFPLPTVPSQFVVPSRWTAVVGSDSSAEESAAPKIILKNAYSCSEVNQQENAEHIQPDFPVAGDSVASAPESGCSGVVLAHSGRQEPVEVFQSVETGPGTGVAPKIILKNANSCSGQQESDAIVEHIEPKLPKVAGDFVASASESKFSGFVRAQSGRQEAVEVFQCVETGPGTKEKRIRKNISLSESACQNQMNQAQNEHSC